MPPVPPLMTSTVAIDRNGNGWLYEPSGIAKPLDLMPLGSTNPGTTPPANPQLGWLWWDSGVNELKVWNGTAWIASSGGGGGGIGEPTTAGSFLRTNTGTWVAGLPLTSTVTDTVPGVTMTVNDTSWSHPGIAVTVDDGYGMSLTGAGWGLPLRVQNNAAAQSSLINVTDMRAPGPTDYSGNASAITVIRSNTNNTNSLLNLSIAGNAPGLNVNQGSVTAGVYDAVGIRLDRRIIINVANLLLGNFVFSGMNLAGAGNPSVPGAAIRAISTGVWSATSAGTRLEFLTAPASAPITPVVRMTIDQDGNLILPGLPTTNPGISGAVWNNGGVLNISP